jgi:hypothetical protein
MYGHSESAKLRTMKGKHKAKETKMKEMRRQTDKRPTAVAEYKAPIWLQAVLKDLRIQFTAKVEACAK